MTTQRHTLLPREHGATAMLLTPFVAAAVLARTLRWQEAAALAAVVAIFAMKDPLVVLARQQWVWKQPHSETRAAVRWVAAGAVVIALCGLALVATGQFITYSVLFSGAAIFSALAVWVNVHNRQRGKMFQVASAVALTSTSLTAALSATDTIPAWCWQLWMLLAMQAAAGIFTVHARLDARVAARNVGGAEGRDKLTTRRLALAFGVLLVLAGVMASVARNSWIGGALLLAGAAYVGDLRRQLNPKSLDMPMKIVGSQALLLSLIYASMVVAGFWQESRPFGRGAASLYLHDQVNSGICED